MTAELRLAGRAGNTRLGGRVLAGLERPGMLRLEGVAPFGAPAFILVAQPDETTLLFPRDDRILTDAPPAEIIEALTGFALTPDDLRAVLSGCVLGDPTPVGGRAYGAQWLAIDLENDATAYLRLIDGRRRIAAATRGPLTIEYSEFNGWFPRRIRLRSPAVGPQLEADVVATLAQLEINLPVPPEAFSVIVPPTAVPLTLDELRRAGPLARSELD